MNSFTTLLWPSLAYSILIATVPTVVAQPVCKDSHPGGNPRKCDLSCFSDCCGNADDYSPAQLAECIDKDCGCAGFPSESCVCPTCDVTPGQSCTEDRDCNRAPGCGQWQCFFGTHHNGACAGPRPTPPPAPHIDALPSPAPALSCSYPAVVHNRTACYDAYDCDWCTIEAGAPFCTIPQNCTARKMSPIPSLHAIQAPVSATQQCDAAHRECTEDRECRKDPGCDDWQCFMGTDHRGTCAKVATQPESARKSVVLVFVANESAADARIIQISLEAKGVDVYNAVDHGGALPSEAQVRNASGVVVLQTQSTVTACPACLVVSYWAVANDVPLVPVSIENGGYSHHTSKSELENLDKGSLPAAAVFLKEHNVDAAKAAWRLGSTLPYIISLGFDGTGSRGGDSLTQQLAAIYKASSLAPRLEASVPGLASEAAFQEWRGAVNQNATPAEFLGHQSDPRRFKVYISNYIQEGGKDGKLLEVMLEKYGVGRAFLDVDSMTDLRQEATNVEQSKGFLIMATEHFFTRPYCLLETYWAMAKGLPVVLVDVAGKGFNWQKTYAFLATLNATSLEQAHSGGQKQMLSFGVSVEEVQKTLASGFKSLTVEPFDSSASAAELEKQAKVIATALCLDC